MILKSEQSNRVYVKLRGKPGYKYEMYGKLIAYDEHLNIMLTDC